ncbi:MAG: TolC family protein [Firmicutes bacterium]|nr:TolC family protein [Bacillota bacterium]
MHGQNGKMPFRGLLGIILSFLATILASSPLAAGEPLDIERAVAAALAHSPELASARAELRAREERGSRRVLDLSGELGYLTEAGGRLSLAATLSPKLGLGADYCQGQPLLFWWEYKPFAEKLENASLDFELGLARLALEKLTITTELEARRLFLQTLAAITDRRLAAAEKALKEKELALLKKRFEAGLLPEQSLLEAEIEALQAGHRLFMAEMAEKQSRRALARLTGLEMEEAPLAELPAFAYPGLKDKGEILAAALSNDLSLKEAEMRLEKAIEEVKKGKDKPDFALRLFWDTSGRLGGSANLAFSFGGSRQETVAKAAGALESARMAVEKARADVEEGVERSLEGLEEAMARVKLAEKEEELAARKVGVAEARLSRGEIVPLEVEKARFAWTRAKEELRKAQSNAWLAWYVLQSAMRGCAAMH